MVSLGILGLLGIWRLQYYKLVYYKYIYSIAENDHIVK